MDILLREHGLDDSRSKGVDTPRVKKSESQVFAGLESPPLDREGVRLYRSGAMRISYLGQDRADVQEAAKCLSRRMQSPTQADLVELKKSSAVPVEINFRVQFWSLKNKSCRES